MSLVSSLGIPLFSTADAIAAVPPVESGLITDNLALRVIVKTVDPDPTFGRLIALSLKEGAILRDEQGKALRIPTTDLVRLTTKPTSRLTKANRLVGPAGLPEGRAERDTVLTLSNGDIIYGSIIGDSADTVHIETEAFGQVSIPLDAIVRMDTPRAFSSAYRDSVRWLNQHMLTDSDHILLTNSDMVRGFVIAVERDGITIEGELGETVIASRLVVAVRLATPLEPRPDPPYAVITLRSTGRVTVKELTWKGDKVEAKLSIGPPVSFDAKRIVRMEFIGGKWEWLAQHRPISYEHTPMLAMSWDFVPDRNVLGKTMTINGESYEHGVGVHSRSSLTYDLKGLYREFVTYFGIDDDSGSMADVSVVILVDGKRRFSQANVRRGELLGPVRIDVEKANRIELVVDFGENGDVQDRFDWIEAALIR